jgi:hypothetical protein
MPVKREYSCYVKGAQFRPWIRSTVAGRLSRAPRDAQEFAPDCLLESIALTAIVEPD